MSDNLEKIELPYFTVSGKPGFDQDGFSDKWMKLGGCGAVTAMESCIYFDIYFGTRLCPIRLFSSEEDFMLRRDISRKDYIYFSRIISFFIGLIKVPSLNHINLSISIAILFKAFCSKYLL